MMITRSVAEKKAMDDVEIPQEPERQVTVLPSVVSCPGSRKSASTCSSKGNSALRVLKAAQLREARVKQEVELERKLLDARTEVELAKLEVEALDDLSDDIKSQCTINKVANYLTSIPTPWPHTSMEQLPEPTKAPVVLGNASELPKFELIEFDGNPSVYWKFIRQFETYIEPRVQDCAQRLLYLNYYCTGEAQQAIEECMMLSPAEGYQHARKILSEQFGQPHMVARSLIDGLMKQAKHTTSDAKSLRDLSRKMSSCQIALSQMDYSDELNAMHTMESIVKSLPSFMRHRWAEIVDNIETSGRVTRFQDLNKFIESRSRVAHNRFGQLACDLEPKRIVQPPAFYNQRSDMRRSRQTFLATKCTEEENVNCSVCSKPHLLTECEMFAKLSVPERWRRVRQLKVCFACLKYSHFMKDCENRNQCHVPGCNARHHSLLHPRAPENSGEVCSITRDTFAPVRLGVVPVKIETPTGLAETYAFLDPGSDVTLVKRSFVDRMLVTVVSTDMELGSLGGVKVCDSVVPDMKVHSIDKEGCVEIERAFVVDDLPVRAAPSIRRLAASWPHLAGIKFDELPCDEVAILIGTDVSEAHWTFDQRLGGKKQPFAIKTLLGWVMLGPLKKMNTYRYATNCISAVEDQLLEQLKRLYNTEFEDTSTVGEGMSVEDKIAVSIVSSSFARVDGHYQLPLPWKQRQWSLPPNLAVVMKRLQYLRKKLIGSPDLLTKYDNMFASYLKKGYIERVNPLEMGNESEFAWYLPHHPVINPRKPGKLRIVFDCAAKCNGVSLNDRLYSGPNLTANLVAVLLRFRLEIVALAADIEEMFLQVKVEPRDRRALRFLWWDNQELMSEPVVFQWSSHPFGATSSPFCASFALEKTVEEFGQEVSIETRTSVKQNFYVDDCLKSFAHSKEAQTFIDEICSLLHNGGFRLRNWTSNDREVISSVAPTERASTLRDISMEPLPVDRTLGLQWDTETDELLITFNLPSKQPTRRGILSCISSLYDPLGFVAPWIVPGKCLLQSICKARLGWDEPLSREYQTLWTNWLHTINNLRQLRVPRCIRPTVITDPVCVELHMFCDASESAYGVVAYARFVSDSQVSACSLVFAKARVAPVKQVSIPRLELTAATLAARVSANICSYIENYFHKTYFWTDSCIVLYYIRNLQSRFSTFVSNRVGTIRDLSVPTQWIHVPSEDNPADLVSRGLCNMNQLNMWLRGPPFLSKPANCWPRQPDITEPDGAEFKRASAKVNLMNTSDGLHRFMKYFSSWVKLQRAIAWLLRYRLLLRKGVDKGSSVEVPTGVLRLSELRCAQNSVIGLVQAREFGEVIRLLQKTTSTESRKATERGTRLQKLSPILIDGILRVGGRLSYSSHSEGVKHQVILPHKHHITELIIRYYHELEGHSGQAQVLAVIRQRFWIINGLSAVKRVIGACPFCRRRSARIGEQLMAPLPLARVEVGWYPFKHTGVDYFGPFKTKRGRAYEKRYGCVFTCLQSRAVHLEMVTNLSTDTFIQCLLRFTGRRGQPTDVYSDNGTNFVGTLSEFKSEIGKMNQRKVSDKLLSMEMQWHFNPPSASHRGGVWERVIRSVRKILLALCKEQCLTDEQLLTFLVEAERILNNRPLVPSSSDSRDPEPLSPSNLLLMRTCPLFPRTEDIMSRYQRGWKQVNYLASVFWRRWLKEYLPTLQVRTKWLRASEELRPGDLVLVGGEAASREKWPLGIIDSCEPSQDGLVRTVFVKTGSGVVRRDVRKVCLLEGGGEPRPSGTGTCGWSGFGPFVSAIGGSP